jgi:hypothetical protein
MLAEAFDLEVGTFYQSAESMPELQFQLDLLGLYGRFIERKYDIYLEEKLQVRVSNVAGIGQRERDLNSIREDHQLLALKVLFTDEQVALFQGNKKCLFSTEDLTRIGIVQVRHDGKPQFIHRTFAEYYVADCLVNRLTEGNNTSQQVQQFILTDIFLKSDYMVSRVFVDGLLSRCEISKETLKPYGSRIRDLGKYAELVIHQGLWDDNANIIGLLLESAQATKHRDTVTKMLLARDTLRNRTVLGEVIGRNMQILEKVWECAKENLTNDEIICNLLLDRDCQGMTAWHMAVKYGHIEVINKLWEWAKENLKKEIKNTLLLATDLNGYTACHVAAENGHLDVFQKLLEWTKENLTTEEINNKLLLATDSEEKTAWHMTAKKGHLHILEKVWEWAEVNLKKEMNKKIILATDRDKRTAWHMAAEEGHLDVLEKLWEWAKVNLTK